MPAIAVERTVGELVKERPGRSRVFEELGIDYCCGGKKPLEKACAAKGLDPEAVAARLGEADAAGADAAAVDADGMALDALADHIVETHHVYLRAELPRLTELTAKVAKVHGQKESRLLSVNQIFAGLRAELEEHMMKEEQVLFPAIRRMVTSEGPVAMPCGSLSAPISVMEHEHDNAGDALARLRELTDDHTPPDWACNTFRAMVDGLRELELDLHQHIHKENNVLFPKALKMEAGRQA